jgi:hypothetical protein
MTLEELKQSQQDLALRKKEMSRQVEVILGSNQISSKGKNRVLQAITGFPDVKPTNITDSIEAGLVTILFEIKNVQIAMYTIQSAIEQKGDTNVI